MCGIGGAISLDGSSDLTELRALVQAVIAFERHRGPDSSGIASFRNGVLGACRLAIQGLESASNQPFRSPDSECTVVFNGEIYNWKELRTELERLGHRYVSQGDTEAIVHAWEQWGIGCLERLDGMFAFTIHDSASETWFFARDRFGVKPFCYTMSGSTFAFASEPKALLSAGLAGLELDEHTVLDYLKYAVTDTGDRTFFSQIRQLCPGHYGLVHGDSLKIERWWRAEAVPAHRADPAEIRLRAERFQRTLARSVALRLRSDVPVGILLSGGIDSSTIASLATRVRGDHPLASYMVSFPGARVDETRFAKLAAGWASLPLHVETASNFDIEAVLGCMEAQAEPFLSPSVVAQWLVLRAVRDSGVRVLLSGQGADEYLAGYEYFDAYAVADFLRSFRFGTALRHMLNERNSGRLPMLAAQLVFILGPRGLRRVRWRKKWLHDTYHQKDSCLYEQQLLNQCGLMESLVFHLAFRLPELLRYEDRNGMHFSIETRHPFLDKVLVETALSGEPEDLVAEGVRKRILRLAVSGDVPAAILERRDKVGFQTPETWYDSLEFRKLFAELCAHAPPEIRAIVDLDYLAHRSLGRRSKRIDADLWRVFSLLLWYREVRRRIPDLRDSHAAEPQAQLQTGTHQAARSREQTTSPQRVESPGGGARCT